MSFIQIRRAAVALALLAAGGCTVKSSETPALSGPSGLALFLNVNASPDTVPQDGGSQSSIKITATGPNGKALASLPIRVDMKVNGVAVDYGTLSARSLTTNSDGVATVVYTAPPPPTNGTFTPCTVEPFNVSLPGGCVSIFASPVSSDYASSNPQSVLIRLVPTGVILPPASAPVAAFTISPTPVNFNVPAIFDASNSCGGPLVGGQCTSATQITNYFWSFGDGTFDSGKIPTHTFVSGTTSFTVTLTVTNDRGLSSSTSQTVTVSASPAPAGDWVFSPSAPSVGETVFFNADAVKPAPGHNLVSLAWSFGDGGSSSGTQTTHVFAAGASYTVVLTATDDAGQKGVITKTLVVGTGNPTATVLISKMGGNTVQADGSGSTSASGTSILNYAYNFGDGTTLVSGSSPTQAHTYALAGTYTVRLTVTDSLGRVGTTTSSITVP